MSGEEMWRLAWWVCLLGIVVPYMVYPGMVVILSLLFGRKSKKDSRFCPRVSIIIATHNEADKIAARLLNIRDCNYPAGRLEIVLVDDASEDGTVEKAQEVDGLALVVVELEVHSGKPTAVNAGVHAASGEVIVFADARQKFERNAIGLLVGNLADEKVAVVSGLLVTSGGGLYWRLERLIRYHEGRLLSTFGATGAFYAMRAADFRDIEPQTILDDVVIPLKAVGGGRRSILDPQAHVFDVEMGAKNEWKRKVRTLAGNYQLLLHPSKMGHPWNVRTVTQFIFHKLGRLGVPLWLAGLLFSSWFVPGMKPFFWVQVACWGIAVLGGIGAKMGYRPRYLRVPFEFMLLNSAAVAAFFLFIFGRVDVRWKR